MIGYCAILTTLVTVASAICAEDIVKVANLDELCAKKDAKVESPNSLEDNVTFKVKLIDEGAIALFDITRTHVGWMLISARKEAKNASPLLGARYVEARRLLSLDSTARIAVRDVFPEDNPPDEANTFPKSLSSNGWEFIFDNNDVCTRILKRRDYSKFANITEDFDYLKSATAGSISGLTELRKLKREDEAGAKYYAVFEAQPWLVLRFDEKKKLIDIRNTQKEISKK